jgi:hypothetical protein
MAHRTGCAAVLVVGLQAMEEMEEMEASNRSFSPASGTGSSSNLAAAQ